MLEKLLLAGFVIGVGWYATRDNRLVPTPFPGGTPLVRMPGASNDSLNATFFYQQQAMPDFMGDPAVTDAEFRRRFRV